MHAIFKKVQLMVKGRQQYAIYPTKNDLYIYPLEYSLHNRVHLTIITLLILCENTFEFLVVICFFSRRYLCHINQVVYFSICYVWFFAAGYTIYMFCFCGHIITLNFNPNYSSSCRQLSTLQSCHRS